MLPVYYQTITENTHNKNEYKLINTNADTNKTLEEFTHFQQCHPDHLDEGRRLLLFLNVAVNLIH